MRSIEAGLALLLALPVAAGAGGATREFMVDPSAPGSVPVSPAGLGGASPFTLASPRLDAAEEPGADGARTGRRKGEVVGLGVERARILLRSLTVPGWGQATLGRRTSAKVFALAETGVWTSFVAFRVQQALRRRASEVTADVFAGIDLDGRDEEFRRIVGIYPSSEEYNRLVVRRDAANLYYDNPVKYRQYIAEHELKGENAWAWESPETFERYQEQRKLTRRAALRANAMLGLAIANRLLSAVHAARYAGTAPAGARSWNIEYGPRGGDPLTMALGVRVRF